MCLCGSVVQLVITHLLITNQNNVNDKITVCIHIFFKLNDFALSDKHNGYGAFDLLLSLRFKFLKNFKKCTEDI
jgi:hypothetical protein